MKVKQLIESDSPMGDMYAYLDKAKDALEECGNFLNDAGQPLVLDRTKHTNHKDPVVKKAQVLLAEIRATVADLFKVDTRIDKLRKDIKSLEADIVNYKE
jgi:hypothetical protein